MNTTSLAYSGAVKVKMRINGRVIEFNNHNSALPKLKEYICRFLYGDATTSARIPQYIDLRKEVSGEYRTCLVKLSPITARHVEQDILTPGSDWYVKFNAVIDSDALLESITASTSDNFRLYLCSGYTKDESSVDLAFMSISGVDVSKITPGTQAIIEWYMRIYDYVEV